MVIYANDAEKDSMKNHLWVPNFFLVISWKPEYLRNVLTQFFQSNKSNWELEASIIESLKLRASQRSTAQKSLEYFLSFSLWYQARDKKNNKSQSLLSKVYLVYLEQLHYSSTSCGLTHVILTIILCSKYYTIIASLLDTFGSWGTERLNRIP